MIFAPDHARGRRRAGAGHAPGRPARLLGLDARRGRSATCSSVRAVPAAAAGGRRRAAPVGDGGHVRELLGDAFDLTIERRISRCRGGFPRARSGRVSRTNFGPVRMLLDNLAAREAGGVHRGGDGALRPARPAGRPPGRRARVPARHRHPALSAVRPRLLGSFRASSRGKAAWLQVVSGARRDSARAGRRRHRRAERLRQVERLRRDPLGRPAR